MHDQQFLAASGWGKATVTPIEGGASTRLLYRVKNAVGQTAILMDKGAPLPPHIAPYEQTIMPDLKPFVQVAQLLRTLGMSAPEIYAVSDDGAFALVEDFGERELLRLLQKGGDARALTLLAMDALATLEKRFEAAKPPMAGLRHYTPEFFVSHLAVIPDVYMPMMCGKEPTPAVRGEFNRLWLEALSQACATTPESLMLRDFKPANTFYLPEREGVNALGIIDFETAGTGPVIYDVAATLRDSSARTYLSAEDTEAAITRFLSHYPTIKRDDFDHAFYSFATMRQVQWAGSCTLYTRQGRQGFLAKLPSIWATIETTLPYSSLAALRAWFSEHIPPSARCAP